MNSWYQGMVNKIVTALWFLIYFPQSLQQGVLLRYCASVCILVSSNFRAEWVQAVMLEIYGKIYITL